MEEKQIKYIYYEELEKKKGERYDFIIKNNQLLTDYSTYAPSCNKLFHVLQICNITNEDSILDIGCGRGVVLLICALFPFRKIGGVEICKQDFDICKENVKHNKNISIFYQDILEFVFWENYNFFYLYNPFSSSTFRKVVQKLPKTCTIIYKNIHDEEKEILKEAGFICEKIIEGEDRPYSIFIRSNYHHKVLKF